MIYVASQLIKSLSHWFQGFRMPN